MLREEMIMTLFDVTVDNRDTMFSETFRVFATCKREAMMKGIKLARLVDNAKGELFAIAKVVR